MATIQGQAGLQTLADGAQTTIRMGRTGELNTSDTHGQLYEAGVRGNLFFAHAIVTAPVIYSTAAGTGGPLIWNGSSTKNVSILKVGIGVTVVTTVAAALGLTGNSGQTSAPTSTTAIDSSGNMLIGGSASASTAYRIGTVTNAGNRFLPFANLHTGALTVDNLGMVWVDIAGGFVIPPNCWGAVAASATASTTVAQICIIYEETNI